MTVPPSQFTSRTGTLGMFLTIALGVDVIVGLGIYTLPGKLITNLGDFAFLAFPVCGALLSIIALNIAQLARRTNRSGAGYVYLTEVVGRHFAFPLGWANWLGATMGLGAFAAVLANILTEGAGLGSGSATYIGLGVVLMMGILNVVGVKPGGLAVGAFTILKLLPLLILGAGGVVLGQADIASLALFDLSAEGFSTGIIMTLFVCQGFEYVPVIAGEVKAATRKVPAATVLALWIATAIYTLLMFGMVGSPIAGSNNPLGDHAVHIFGEVGGNLVGAFALLSILGLIAGRALAAPRLLIPLAEDGFFSASLVKPTSRFPTPWRAIALTTICALPFVFVTRWEELISIAALGVAINYFIACAVNCWHHRHSRWRDIFLPVLGVLFSLFFLYQIPIKTWVYLGGMIALGYLVRAAFGRWQPTPVLAVHAEQEEVSVRS